jgi:hypothetical protein
MPRVGTGHATYFWVIQHFKPMNLSTEKRTSAVTVLASRSDYKTKIKTNKKKKIILYLIQIFLGALFLLALGRLG